MSEIFHKRPVRASRKQRMCSWCGTHIEVGQPYDSYRWRNQCDNGHCEMHPECLTACDEVSYDEGGFFLFGIGDFHRGCGCASGDCRCHESTDDEAAIAMEVSDD